LLIPLYGERADLELLGDEGPFEELGIEADFGLLELTDTEGLATTRGRVDAVAVDEGGHFLETSDSLLTHGGDFALKIAELGFTNGGGEGIAGGEQVELHGRFYLVVELC
jgi:hypothetical protein